MDRAGTIILMGEAVKQSRKNHSSNTVAENELNIYGKGIRKLRYIYNLRQSHGYETTKAS